MARRKTGIAVLVSSVLLLGACDSPESAATRAAIAEGCVIDSECSSPLVCAFRTCHVQCESSRDCEKIGSALCVQSDKPYRVCQNPNESKCQRNSECPGEQICGADARCRDACLADRDCGASQICTARVCVDEKDLIGGVLPVAKPPASGDTCIRASDCGSDLVCIFGVCTVECVTAKDCDEGLACLASRCGLPNVVGNGGAAGRAGAGGFAGVGGAGLGGAGAGGAGQAGLGGAPTGGAAGNPVAGSGGLAGKGGAGAGQAGTGGASGKGGAAGGAAGTGGMGTGGAGTGGAGGQGGGACVTGASCATGNACELGKLECATGKAVCVGAGSRAEGTECRAKAGICDVAEVCDGVSPTCPPDSRETAGTECRAATGVCDVGEVCDGTTAACPDDLLRPNDFLCRPAAGACDAPEICDGASPLCPGDERVDAGTVCRAAAGACDAAETCDGSGESCPPDVLQGASFVCRAAVSSCDLAESCSGTSSSCPLDAFSDVGDACAGGFCNGLGSCLGTCTPGAACSTGNPCELGKIDCSGGVPACVATGPGNPGALCRPSAGPCDVEDFCSGASTTCPDARVGAGQVCRASQGICDPAEKCNGTAVACPIDAFEPPSFVCRGAAAGGCDVAETCTGTTAACPADAFAPATKVCRTGAGFCDVAERCTGGSAMCPADAFQAATVECRASGGVCDPAERCTGSAALCPADQLFGAAKTCRDKVDSCDVAEVCNGAQATCPTNGFVPVGTTCVAGQCDVAGICAIQPLCKHRWRVATDIDENKTLFASDVTAVVAGIAPKGPRADGHGEVDGKVKWQRADTGTIGGRASSRYVLYENAGTSDAHVLGVHDLHDGTPISAYKYADGKNFSVAIGSSAVDHSGKASVVSGFAEAQGAWTINANGKVLSGSGPSGVFIAHGPNGELVAFLEYAKASLALTPTALYDGRWAVPVAVDVPTFFGKHSVPAGSNELIILTPALTFERFVPVSFAPTTMTVVPTNNLRVLSDGRNRTAAYDDAKEVWSNPECGGSTLSASGKQVFVVGDATTTFCGRPVPSGLGPGVGVAVLEATTGKVVSVRFFPSSVPPSLAAVSVDGDAYFYFSAGATVCGTTHPATTILAY